MTECTWHDFSTSAPDLARRVHACFTAGKHHVLATLRQDGSPRVSGTEVDFAGEELTFGSMLGALKARDLQRDGRFALHAGPGPEDMSTGDAKLAGVASEVPAEDMHLFHLDIHEVVLTWVDGNALVIESWKPGGHHVRFERPENGPALRHDL